MARRKIAFLFNYDGYNAEAQNLWENIRFAHEAGYECIVVGPPSRVIQQSGKVGIRVYPIEQLAFHNNPVRHLTGLIKLLSVIRIERPDVLHIFYRSAMHAMGIIANRLTGNRMMIVRTRGTATPVRRNLGNRILYQNDTHLTIVPSERERKQMRDFGIPPDRVETLHFPLDTEHFDPNRYNRDELRKKYGVHDEFCLAHIGRFEPIKGHQYLLEAAKILEREGFDFTLLLVGNTDYPYFQKVESMIGGNVRLVGWIEDVAELIAASDAGVISSIGSEANSRVALEFMAMKKPLVTTDAGILPDIIPGHGIVVPHSDAKKLADGIRKLARSDMKTMGERSFEFVHQHFERDVIRSRFLQIYRNILQD